MPNQKPDSPLSIEQNGLPWAWLAALITLAYAALALWSLGSTNIPQTWFTPQQAGESFTIDMGGQHVPDNLYLFTGIGEGGYKVDISTDGQNWTPLADAKRKSAFIWSWSVIKIVPPPSGALSGRYLRWTVTVPGEMIHELAITELQPPTASTPIGPDGRPQPGQAITGLKLVVPDPGDPFLGNPERQHLIDEPGTFIYYPDTEHDMVFDEVYHARTAWEHLNRMEPYEWTHPPLGKLIIATGIAVFGMDPFGWRLPAVLFGIAMLPLIFVIARRLFGDPAWALVAQLLFALDFMHFTQSRLGLVDAFMVFFVMAMLGAFWRWYSLVREGEGRLPRQSYLWLVLSGLFLGLAASTKWNALYAGVGLAILFFVALIGRVRRGGGPLALILTLGVALVGFVAVPLGIYYLSYIPYFLVPGHKGGWAEIWDWQQKMYAYHRDLDVPHSFASPWWQWPLLFKPVWYYTARDTMPSGFTATVAAFGNPAIWWLTFPALIAGVWRGWKRRDAVLVFLVVVFLSLYLPWIVVPRKVTFIYHFFPMVPVLCLLLARLMQGFMVDRLADGLPTKPLKLVYAGYLGLAVLLFLLFYPVLSGVTTPLGYINFLHWIPGWFF